MIKPKVSGSRTVIGPFAHASMDEHGRAAARIANCTGMACSAQFPKMDRRADVYVSTLAKFIEAMGGKLVIRAVFPDGAVKINRFGDSSQS